MMKHKHSDFVSDIFVLLECISPEIIVCKPELVTKQPYFSHPTSYCCEKTTLDFR